MEALNKITTLINEYNAADQALREALRADAELVIEQFFADLFARHPGLKRAVVCGYTPGFNDGDPCTHSSEVYVGQISEYSSREYMDYSDHGESELFFTDEGKIENPNKDCKTIREAKAELRNWEDIFERVYNTNFIIKAKVLEDGTVDVDVDDYDCGY